MSLRLLRCFYSPHNINLYCLWVRSTNKQRWIWNAQQFLSDESGELQEILEKNRSFSYLFYLFVYFYLQLMTISWHAVLRARTLYVLSLLQCLQLIQKAALQGICPDILQINYIYIYIWLAIVCVSDCLRGCVPAHRPYLCADWCVRTVSVMYFSETLLCE